MDDEETTEQTLGLSRNQIIIAGAAAFWLLILLAP